MTLEESEKAAKGYFLKSTAKNLEIIFYKASRTRIPEHDKDNILHINKRLESNQVSFINNTNGNAFIQSYYKFNLVMCYKKTIRLSPEIQEQICISTINLISQQRKNRMTI